MAESRLLRFSSRGEVAEAYLPAANGVACALPKSVMFASVKAPGIRAKDILSHKDALKTSTST